MLAWAGVVEIVAGAGSLSAPPQDMKAAVRSSARRMINTCFMVCSPFNFFSRTAARRRCWPLALLQEGPTTLIIKLVAGVWYRLYV